MKIRNISKGLFFVILPVLFFNLTGNGMAEETVPEEGGIIHIIEKGDTLWDISGAYLRNPFLWSSIWEKNRYIKNPDLIYPGDKIVIPADKSTVGEIGGQASEKADMDAVTEEPAGAISVPVATVPPVPTEPEGVEIPESIRSGFVYTSSPSPVPAEKGKDTVSQNPAPIIGEEMVFMGGYIADKVNSAGIITKSSDDRNVSAAGDSVNIFFNNKKEKAAIGERFMVLRKPKSIIHPKTDKYIGSIVVPVGIVEIYRIQGGDAGGRIIKSYDYISAGDQIQPLQPAVPVKEVSRVTRGVTGYIIGSREETILTAERSIVYLDRGAKDGITTGVVFNVTGDNPNSILGELMVISVQVSTSTALVTKSIEPFGVGNKIVAP